MLPTMLKITLVDFLTCQVRQIRSMESQVKWDMYREERCQTEEERREEAHGTAISADFSWKFFKKAALGPLDFSVGFVWIFLLEGGVRWRSGSS